IGSGMSTVSGGGDKQDVIADHQAHQAMVEQRTQDSNISNDVKHRVDNMVTAYSSDISSTQESIRGKEKTVSQQYSDLQKEHETEALSQNNKYNEEKAAQERVPGADTPDELLRKAQEYQDKNS
ncbi:conjugal transfer protein TraG, partial [Salmonella enterica subsp. enterica serovar Typhimurium]|nr:conjugal transfer protein TraG [Salmonella enterica subsp. enterica serovar Typhimurium]